LYAIPGVQWTTTSIRRLYDWMGTFVHSPYGTWILGALFFIESIFFIPTDPLLIVFCIENRKKSIWYATVATAGSVIGGMVAYGIGLSVWSTIGQPLVNIFASKTTFDALCIKYKLYQNWAVLIAGFTPMIPYKLVTLTAGFCKLSFVPFVICSLIARGARFFMVGIAVYIWGSKIKTFIDTHFNTLLLTFVVLLVASLVIVT
jgi:membrane protein YqaA with SNARE-associated domain